MTFLPKKTPHHDDQAVKCSIVCLAVIGGAAGGDGDGVSGQTA